MDESAQGEPGVPPSLRLSAQQKGALWDALDCHHALPLQLQAQYDRVCKVVTEIMTETATLGTARSGRLRMDDLARWLGEQLAEDERIARAAAKRVSSPPNDGVRWRRDWDTVHTAPSDPPGPRAQVADCGHGAGDLTAHIAAHDPARVLREIDAKRKLLKALLSEGHTALRPGGSTEVYCDADYGTGSPCDCGRDDRVSRYLRLLALPYADRPGYREEWRP